MKSPARRPYLDLGFPDNYGPVFGDQSDVYLRYNSKDANANMIQAALPEGDGTNVPVFLIADATVLNKDLGTDLGIDLSGITEPRVVLLDDDGDSWVGIGFSADDTAAIMIGGLASLTLPALSFGDDIALSLGAGSPAKFLWETADANANALCLVLPAGGATDVPVFVIGDAGILNKDLTWFNGITGPSIALVDADEDSYLLFGFGNNEDDIGIISGGGAFTYLKIGPIVLHLDDISISNTKSIRTNAATAGEYFTLEAYDDGVAFVPVAVIMNAANPYIAFGGASGDSCKFYYDGSVEFASQTFDISSETLADDGTRALPDATTGMGFVIFGDHDEWGWFTWSADGSVTIQSAKDANLVTTDTDTKYCIYDSGTQVIIKNRSGSSKVLQLFAFYK